MLFVFNIVPAFPLDGGRIARALIWWRTGDRNRATLATGRVGPGLRAGRSALFGLWASSPAARSLGLLTMVLAFFLYQAAGAAVVQGALGRRIQNITVADIMDREPVTIPAEATLLDAQEQFFLRYRWPWFAVVDPARHFLGVVRQQRVESEIAAGRPALAVADMLEEDLPVRDRRRGAAGIAARRRGPRPPRRDGGGRQRRGAAGRRDARPGAPGAAARPT